VSNEQAKELAELKKKLAAEEAKERDFGSFSFSLKSPTSSLHLTFTRLHRNPQKASFPTGS
jgi:hypothetical protein